MIGLLSFVVRVVVLAGFTFGFVVLFEHGPQGFVAGAPVELDKFETFLVSLKNRQQAPAAPEPAPAPAPAVPAATPAPTPVATTPAAPAAGDSQPSAWEQLQSRPVGAGLDTPVATPFPTDN